MNIKAPSLFVAGQAPAPLSDTSSPNYRPEFSRPVEIEQKSYASNVQGTRKTSNAFYSLVLVDSSKGLEGSELTYLEPIPVHPGSNGSSYYDFYYAPRSTSMVEPMAVSIQPTQDGKHFVEHQGQLFKQITIQGTTGFRPKPIAAKAPSISSQAQDLFSPLSAPTRKIPPNEETTGYQEFMKLRNVFRYYADLKRTEGYAEKVVMVFINAKEGEAYIVEPRGYTTTRDTRSKFHFNYTINLQTLDFVKTGPRKSPDPLNRVPTGFDALLEYGNRVIDLTDSLNSEAERLSNLGISSIGKVLVQVNRVSDNISRALKTGTRLINTPRIALSSLRGSVLQVKRDFDRLLEAARATLGVNGGAAAYAKTAAISHTLTQYLRSLDHLLSNPSLFQERASIQSPLLDAEDEYAKSRDNLLTGGGRLLSSSTLNSGSASDFNFSSLLRYRIQRNDTLDGIALKLYGDLKYIRDIIIINRLKPPYLSVCGRPDTLGSGDILLVPQGALLNGANQVLVKDDPVSDRRTSALDKFLGTDLRVVQDQATGLYDLSISPSGDLETVSGVDNLEQAMRFRLKLKRGDLKMHPQYGLEPAIGEKLTPLLIFKFDKSVRAVLQTDTRISSVNSVSFELTDANVVTARIRALVGNSSKELDITDTLGRR